jgi:parallel beta-helix repeat protein
MKNLKNDKKLNIYVLFSILLITLLGCFTQNNLKKNNPLTREENGNPYLSAGEITIITPEDKTYIAPMNGYYPGTWGFENETDGVLPGGWDDSLSTPGETTQVYPEMDGHNKTMKIYDNEASAGQYVIVDHTFDNVSSGTFEFWIYQEAGDSLALLLTDSSTGRSPIFFSFDQFGNGKIQYWNNFTNNDLLASITPNVWYHLRVDFDLTYDNQSIFLKNSTGDLLASVINDTVMDAGLHDGNVDKVLIGTEGIDVSTYHFDAFGFSWDPDYNVGDNLNEGLLLSYENTTNLDWKGYSLDGQTNVTIYGNTTIPMPNVGTHTIQIFGNNTIGTDYKSAIRYFYVSYINILTPEEKTYYAPMNGYYPGTCGFENETDGVLPGGWDDYLTTSGEYSQVYSEIGGHKKTLKIYDNDMGVNEEPVLRYRFNNVSDGTIEFWIYQEVGASLILNLIDSSVNSSSPIQFYFDLTNNAKIQYNNNVTSIDLYDSFTSGNWYHIRLDFDLNNNNQSIFLRNSTGDLLASAINDSVAFSGTHSGIVNMMRIGVGFLEVATYHFDSIGFSWDPNYNIGDNLNEGLLLSYENTTNLDWEGYSLDGQTNVTIYGNKTIPFLNHGLHSIQVSGNGTSGTMYKTKIRYFMISLESYWEVSSIHITGANWSSTKGNYSWCNGAGTWSDPYVIENVTIDAGGSGSGIYINNSKNVYFEIRNCTVYNSGVNSDDAGIRLENACNGTLYDNNCSQNGRSGILLRYYCFNNTISTNKIYDNTFGISITDYCENNTIFNNTIGNLLTTNQQYGIYTSMVSTNFLIANNTISNHIGNGISLSMADNTIIANNTLDSNRVGVYISAYSVVLSANTMVQCGVYIYDSLASKASSHTIYDNNSVNGKHIYYITNENNLNTDNFTDHGAPGQIILVNCNNSQIKGFNISNCSIGINLVASNNNTISNNTNYYNEEYGVCLINSKNNTLFNNSIRYNRDGIGLFMQSKNNNITKNTIESSIENGITTWSTAGDNITSNIIRYNAMDGIYLGSSSNNFFIFNNTINDNGDSGIDLYSSTNNIIINNTCYDTVAVGGNQLNGIALTYDSIENFISKNNVSDNQNVGIDLQQNSHNNTISENYACNNGDQGIDISDCNEIKIYDNIIYDNVNEGIRINNGNNTRIQRNNITWNWDGIYMLIGNDNIITDNIINNSNDNGIELDTINNSTIIGNRLNVNVGNINQLTCIGNLEMMNSFDGVYTPCIINDTSSPSTDSITWAEAALYHWCSGSGTWNDPFIIEGITINGQNSGSCLVIGNSSVYFIIRYCTLYNTGIIGFDSGIYLENTNNSFIIENTCSSNGRNGITLYLNSCNNTIEGNTVNNNNNEGITLDDGCNNNTITKNTAGNLGSTSQSIGISLENNCNENDITHNNVSSNFNKGIWLLTSSSNFIFNNTVNNNQNEGIHLATSSNNNTLKDNTCNNDTYGLSQETGIKLQNNCNNNTVENNIVDGNDERGIHLWSNCNENDVINNNVTNNNWYGINLEGSSNNAIINNEVYDKGVTNQLVGIFLISNSDDNLVENNTIYDNNNYGIQLDSSSGNNRIKNNTVVNKITSYQEYGIYLRSDNNTISENTANNNTLYGIYLLDSHNNTIKNNTAKLNGEHGIYLEGSNNNTISNNSESFNFNTNCGIYLNNSHGNQILGNNASNNAYGIYLNHSNYNAILNNIFQGNTLNNTYETPDCVGNYFQVGDGGENGGKKPGNGTPPDEFPLLIVIILIVGIIGSAGGVFAVKKSSKEKSTSKPKTIGTALPAEKKVLIPTKAEPKLPKKKPKLTVAAAPGVLTEMDKKEIDETEAELGIEKQQFTCIVHKGPIEGDNYLCPNCNTFYCVKCALVLKEKGEKCWSCDNEITISTAPTEALKTQEKIRDLEQRLASLKQTVKMIDDNYYSGDLDEEEYNKMKDPVLKKITQILADIKNLKS